MLPHLDNELVLWKKSYTVIGIDEVGRGAFAGPLCVAGVIFKPCFDDKKRISYLLNLGINDSKKLSKSKRELLSKVIQNECFSYHISTIDNVKIDRFGIAKATFMGMRSVVKNLRENSGFGNNYLLTDAFKVKNTFGLGLKNQLNIIKGDTISLSIAAASIIAKVYRDDLMKAYSSKYPNYGFSENVGYGTLLHRKALRKFGPTPLHRTQFIHKFI